MKIKLKTLALLTSVLAISACTNHHQTEKHRTTFVRDNAEEPYTLDPAKAQSVYSTNVLFDIGAGLFALNQANQPVPDIAYKWSRKVYAKNVYSNFIVRDVPVIMHKKGDVVYTFYLRKNAKWSNGKPVTAQDFVYELRRVVDPKTASPSSYKITAIKNAQAIMDGRLPPDHLGVVAVNDHELKIYLDHPVYYFLNIMADPVTYPIYVPDFKKYGDLLFTPDHYVSDGAYNLKQWVHNGFVLVSKNNDYWDADHVHIPNVKFVPIVNRSSALNQYKSGQVDYTQYLPTGNLAALKKQLPGQIYTTPSLRLEYLDLNLTKAPMKDNLALRKALSMVIDRKAIVQHVTNEGDIPVYSFFPPSIENGMYARIQYKWATWTMKKRIEIAKQLYKHAGYSSAHPLSLTIEYNTDPTHKKVMEAVANMWHQTLGVNVTLENMEHKVFLDEREAHHYAAVARDGWAADFNTIDNYASMWTCGNVENSPDYCNKHYDALIVEGEKQVHYAAAYQYYSQALELIMQDYPIIPLYSEVNVHAMKPYIKGYHPAKNHLDILYDKWLSFED